MKKKEELKESQGKLTPSEKADLEWITEELHNFLEEALVSESGLMRLENVLTSFLNLKRNYAQRVIRLLKQGHMLD